MATTYKRSAQNVWYTEKNRFFLDTEFIENGKTVDLVSIGLVSGDGREYYACNQEADLTKADDWVRANVLPKLPQYGDPAWKTRAQIRAEVTTFLSFRHGLTTPEIWTYYGATDWVAFYQLWGKMVEMPEYLPKHTMDLKQLAVMLGNPKLPKQTNGEHNALLDARWNYGVYEFLRGYVTP